MSSKIEMIEKNLASVTLHIPADRFEEGMNYSYNKNKAKLKLPGFRAGKVPRALAEKSFGVDVFLDDAINFCFPQAYEQVIEELDFEPVSRPELKDPVYDKETGILLPFSVWVKPEVKLGEYKGLSYSDKEVTVSDEEITALLESEQRKNSRQISVSDRSVMDGDTIIIDFEGFIDGVPFDGGKAEDYELKIGSKTFIDTFEEQLIGKNIGEDVIVSVTFPDDYGKEELRSKPASFNVTINDITKIELPELNDEFAQDVSEFDTLDEYKNSIKEKLITQKEEEKERQMEETLIKAAAENAECDIPNVMYEGQIDQLVSEFSNRLSGQGVSLDMFLRYSGKSYNEFREGYRDVAEHNVRARLVLEAIADAENIEPSEQEIDEELNRMSQAYGIDLDRIKDSMNASTLKGLKTDLKVQKALELIKQNAAKTN